MFRTKSLYGNSDRRKPGYGMCRTLTEEDDDEKSERKNGRHHNPRLAIHSLSDSHEVKNVDIRVNERELKSVSWI